MSSKPQSNSPQNDLKLTPFVLRPEKNGVVGRKTKVLANFFKVKTLPQGNIIHYDVTITPEPKALAREVFHQFELVHGKKALNGTKPVFDGRSNMFSPRVLTFSDPAMFKVTLPQDVPSSKNPPKSFNIKFKKVNSINMEEVQRFLNSLNEMTPNCKTAIQALDVLIRQLPSTKYPSFGNSFYVPQDARQISGGAEVWQGYYQSFRPVKGRLMINVDVSFTAFYEGGPLPQVICKLLGLRDLRNGLNLNDRKRVESTLKRLKISVTHRGPGAAKHRFKLFKLTQTSASETKFEVDGKTTDVATYFAQKYGPLQYPNLPCVVYKEMAIPLEVCSVVEGQRIMKELNERQRSDMIKVTCQRPNVRANRIKSGIELLNYQNNAYINDFGLQIFTQMTEVAARVLPPPILQYNASSRDALCQPPEGAWNLMNKRLAEGANLKSWSVVVFDRDSQKTQMKNIQFFIREFVKVCEDTGMTFGNRTPPIMHANPIGNIEATLKHAFISAKKGSNQQAQMIMCILPNRGNQLYEEIKRISDTVLGIVTQCVQSDKIIKPNKMYCANVCLKVNVKLGGVNVYLKDGQMPFLEEKPTIIMGADVVHPPKGMAHLKPSIAALCSSIDRRATKYAGSTRAQRGTQETIDDLGAMVQEALKSFYQNCKAKPQRILFYRDGVGEGHFAELVEKEVKAIQDACQKLEHTYKPKLTYIVVQKRHKARFFPMDRSGEDRSGNCLPGTVIESEITHPFEFDFYLQSHAGIQGTSRSAHYHMIFDENSFSADGLQQFTYNLCYTFARATRSVSIVPPVYYADILCARARFHLNGETWSGSSEGSGSEASTNRQSSLTPVLPSLKNVQYYL